jgi:RimJ/RimL family protein N-acetyltransferase
LTEFVLGFILVRVTATQRFDTLSTDRLLMRRWLDSDREPFAALNGDSETMRFFPQTMDRTASDALVDHIESRFEDQGYGLWALEVVDTGQFIGFTGLNPMPDGTPGAGGLEAGWRLAKSAWHHGYATEAAKAALVVAYERLGLDEIWSMTSVLNKPSIAVMLRLGMSEATKFDHPRIQEGHVLRLHVAYRLTSAEFARTKAA